MATSSNLKKTKDGYSYKYTDLAEIHNYLEDNGIRYWQYIEPFDGADFIYTVPIIDGKELQPRRGCRVVNAPLTGKSNPAQQQGSALTYARRYSLLMAFGLATTDDDGDALTEYTDAKTEAKDRAAALKRLNELCEAAGTTPESFCMKYNRKFNPNNLDQIKQIIATMERSAKWN